MFALIVARKAEGEHDDTEWNESYSEVSGAKSYFEGLANTNAMVEAGSALAKWARDLRIDGHDDWYLTSLSAPEVGSQRRESNLDWHRTKHQRA